MRWALVTVELRSEQDIVLARQRARQVAELLGFDIHGVTRLATAVSEIARNAFQYGGGGRVALSIDGDDASLVVEVSDKGKGIADVQAVLEGRYESETGMGVGITGARKLMDRFELTSSGAGTRVTLAKRLPPGVAPTADTIKGIAVALAAAPAGGTMAELLQQNRALLDALSELESQHERLAQVNRELEDTNRGVVALLAELDERAYDLRRASDVKSHFLSSMTHELRTPVVSILSLTRILLDRLDGPLNPEQAKQVGLVRTSAEALSDIINDLLDLAKVEAGKVRIQPTDLSLADLFGALRGMLRPLVAHNEAVDLVFDEPPPTGPLYTDESKVSQILRNFISNALKYTEQGEVRVQASLGAGDTIVVSVIDTGIGIAPEDQERIFEEYIQLDTPLQRKARGTGLGLPLTRKLAALLGGTVGLKSEPGVGSTFYVVLPRRYQGPPDAEIQPDAAVPLDPMREPVLVVDDDRDVIATYERFLAGTPYQVIGARTLREARERLRAVRPAAVVLDILLEGESTWSLLADLKAHPATAHVPVAVATVVGAEARARAMGADAFAMKPIARDWLLSILDDMTKRKPRRVLLLVDDDPVSRYLLKNMLHDAPFGLIEASTGAAGIDLARRRRPTGIFLDLTMQGMDGYAVLDVLKADPATRPIPVIVYTARELSEPERSVLAAAAAVVGKNAPTREAAQADVRAALQAAGLMESLT